ncbi:hypothetical protein OAF87_02720 [Akkermansiaceae bacterium]|nr:hypothetical protein [Akkermansiaceae bacterium]MDB4740712.1 hypothetical protein [Akkermansiaceae bacterium]
MFKNVLKVSKNRTKKTNNMSKSISKEIAEQGAPGDEFIVGVDFNYCDVNYSGYQILTRTQIVKLCKQLDSDRQIGTPNMPGDWWEEFDISELKGAFTIHSDRAEDVGAMRGLFGGAVGNTDLFEEAGDGLWDEEDEDDEDEEDDREQPEFIDLAVAQRYKDNVASINLASATGIDDDAAALLGEIEDEIDLSGLTELSHVIVDNLTKKGKVLCLVLRGITDISDALADALTKNNAEMVLFLDGLTELSDNAAEALARSSWLSLGGLSHLSDAAVESLSKHNAHLCLDGLTELSDAAAESLSKNEGELYLDGLTELSDAAAESLSKHEGLINCEDSADWVESMREE